MRREAREWLVVAAIATVVFLALGYLTWTESGPAIDYFADFVVTLLVFVLFALGLSLEFGTAGILNLGHVAFTYVGAYSTYVFYEAVEPRNGDKLSAALAGGTPLGLAVAAFLAVIAGLVVLVPSMALAGRAFRRSARPALLLAVGLVAGTIATSAAFWSMRDLGEDGARNAVLALGFLVGVVLAVIGGLLIGLPTLRLREDYFAIVTLGAAEIVRAVVEHAEITRGTEGFNQLWRPHREWLRENPWWRAWWEARGFTILGVNSITLLVVVLAFVALAFLVLEVLARSPWGRVLKGIREDEDAAAALGKDVFRFKLQALMIGSALAAIAGVLYSWRQNSVYPGHFHTITFYAFIIVVLGGVGNHKGTIAGALVFWGLYQVADRMKAFEKYGLQLTGAPQGIALGVLLVLVMLFRPQGALGSKEDLVHGR